MKQFKEKEAIQQVEIAEARKLKAQQKKDAECKIEEAKARAKEVEKKREEAWKAREKRVDEKRSQWVEEIQEEKKRLEKEQVLREGRKKDYIKDLHIERQKVFAEQTKKSLQRKKTAEETKLLEQTDSKPPPPPEESPNVSKKQRIDAIEQRMREEIQKAKEVQELENSRNENVAAKEATWIAEEAQHAKELRAAKRAEDDRIIMERDQQRVVIEQRKEEERRAEERKQVENVRLNKLRDENIERIIQSRISTADCKPPATAA